jgi:regulatory protein
MPDQEALRTAKSQAFKHLSYRDRSKQEVAHYLREKGHAPSTIKITLQDLEKLNYINDHHFAIKWGRWCVEVKKFGKKRMRHELLAKGVSSHIIETALDMLYSSFPEQDLALACVNKKLASLNGIEPEKKMRRLAQHLQRRGFSADIIYEALKAFTTKHGGT